MDDDLDIRPNKSRTTTKAASRILDNEPPTDTCVICLDPVSERTITSSCRHQNFDFLCLISWLQERPTCPLCNASVAAVEYDLRSATGHKSYTLPLPSNPPSASTTAAHLPTHPVSTTTRPSYRRPRRPYQPLPSSAPSADAALDRRRHIYRHNLYSLHVGANRLSKYQTLTPASFAQDPDLVSRARKWIRRELQVFSFLNPTAPSPSPTPSPTSALTHNGNSNGNADAGSHDGERTRDRRANNAEFLLEYVVAILKTVDTQGSGGQAEEMLSEFLGRENTRLFLHELRAWLRSPYRVLGDWDRNVQYGEGLRKGWGEEVGRGGKGGREELGGRRRRGFDADGGGGGGGVVQAGVAVRESGEMGKGWRREPYPDRRLGRGTWRRS